MRNRTSAPLCLQRTQPDSDRCKRPWRSIEAAGANTQAEVTQFGGHPLPRSIQGLDFDRAWKDACEESVQRTAIVPVLIAMMSNGCRIIPTMHMLMMLVRRDDRLEAQHTGQRRRHDPRELGKQKKANQQADEASYGS